MTSMGNDEVPPSDGNFTTAGPRTRFFRGRNGSTARVCAGVPLGWQGTVKALVARAGLPGKSSN